MSLLKQIEDKGAVLEWSPVQKYPNLVALGTKDSSGIGFDDYGGEIELHALDLGDTTNAKETLVGKARANSRFASLAWSRMGSHEAAFPYGLIAGGMMDGKINVWDPSKFNKPNAQPLLATVEQHQGNIAGLQFNPHQDSHHLLASGGQDGEVFVMSLEAPETPNVYIPAPPPNNVKHTADITKVAWNSQVAHILATSAQNGVCYIWDLRQKKAWCELKDPTGGMVSDIAWNPDQGLHFVTASGEDRNPVLKLWDLRSSTSVPLATLQSHTEGVLSVSWCPTDSSFLLSTGKDNRTILWDLHHLQPVYDLPNTSETKVAPAESNSMFGGLANRVGQKRYHISWSPCLKSMVSACSFDRKVQFFSLSGVQSKTHRAPKWLKRPAGVAFGFGGKLTYFDNSNVIDAGAIQKQINGAVNVGISQIYEDPSLIELCTQFQTFLAEHGATGYKDYCEAKAVSSDVTHSDRHIWELMSVICFGKNAREELLSYLGYKSNDIANAVEKYIKSKNRQYAEASSSESLPPAPTNDQIIAATSDVSKISLKQPIISDNGVSAESIFGSAKGFGNECLTPVSKARSEMSQHSEPSHVPETVKVSNAPPSFVPSSLTIDTSSSVPIPSVEVGKLPTVEVVAPSISEQELESEKIIRESIIVGNFKAAVECCLQTGQYAEALILAQCGEQDLWVKTQEAVFDKQKNKHKYIVILHSIIKNDLLNYVLSSDVHQWRETLAVLSTYGKSDEFPTMCEKLGSRLIEEIGDKESATLCYMCAANVNETVRYWTEELRSTHDAVGHINTKSLQNYIEKVTVFTQANPSAPLPQESTKYFAQYANILASQGRFDTALNYLKGTNKEEEILIDRLYNASSITRPANAKPPVFPFDKIVVNPVVSTSKLTTTAVTTATTIAQNAQHISSAATANRFITNPSTSTVQSQIINRGSAQPTVQPVPLTPTATPQQIAPGWVQGLDQASGRTYYYNPSTSQSQWEAPMVDATPTLPITSAIKTSQSNEAFNNFQYQSQSSQSLQPIQQQPQLQPQNLTSHQSQIQPSQQPQVGRFGSHSSIAANPNPQPVVAAINPAAAQVTAPVQVQPKALLPDSEAILLLEQVIITVSAAAAPAERRQMVMVNEAFSCLRKRASEGEVSPEVLSKVHQIANDLVTRNFYSASTIQTDLANTAWNQHKDWIKGLKVFIQIASKK